MAFQNKLHDVPRDPEAMAGRINGAARFLTGTIVLLLAVIVAGLFFVSGTGRAPAQRSVISPSATESGPTAPQPATGGN
jgi:hypothetical protein